MSCRVIGRKIEVAFISIVGKLNGNFITVVGKYSKTKKNGLVKDFYKDLVSKIDEWTYSIEKNK